MSSIRRLTDKKYRIVYNVPSNGKRKQKTETLAGVTKKEAEAIYAQRMKEVSDGKYAAPNGGMTCDDLFVRFMKSRARLCAPSTLQQYEVMLKVRLRPSFGAKKLADIKTIDILSAYESWADSKVGARTIIHAHNLLRATLNKAVKWELISRSPADSISPDDLPKPKRHEPTALDEAGLQTLLREARQPTQRSINRRYLSTYSAFYPAIFFAAYTGARRGEVLAIRWTDLNLDSGEVTIARSLTDAGKCLTFKRPKNNRSRTISISKALVVVMRAHRASQAAERLALGAAYQDQALAFARPDGSPFPPWNFGVAFRNLVERAGVKRIRLHDLRDTHASLLAKAGIPIQVISKRLGHSSIGITFDRYLAMYRDQDEAAASAFDRLVG